jgi:hypothetical protein
VWQMHNTHTTAMNIIPHDILTTTPHPTTLRRDMSRLIGAGIQPTTRLASPSLDMAVRGTGRMDRRHPATATPFTIRAGDHQ